MHFVHGELKAFGVLPAGITYENARKFLFSVWVATRTGKRVVPRVFWRITSNRLEQQCAL